jgi:hypothetical protein
MSIPRIIEKVETLDNVFGGGAVNHHRSAVAIRKELAKLRDLKIRIPKSKTTSIHLNPIPCQIQECGDSRQLCGDVA